MEQMRNKVRISFGLMNVFTVDVRINLPLGNIVYVY